LIHVYAVYVVVAVYWIMIINFYDLNHV